MSKIQETRKKLNTLISEQLIPLRKELDRLLDQEAQKLCPFNIGDTIILENNKKGVIKAIEHHSLDYGFSPIEDIEAYDTFTSKDNVDHLYAYSIDNEEFSITWKISGIKLKKGDEEGKWTFNDISPDVYNIDVEGMKITGKKLNELVNNDSYISSLFDIDNEEND